MRLVILVLGLPGLLWGQKYNFTQEYDSIPVEVEGYDLPVPWTGGYSVSCPDFCDIDADGDKDFFIGNISAYISFFENTGTVANPDWTLIDERFAGIDNGIGVNTQPQFWDMDADGDFDLSLGNANEVFISVYQNIGTSTDFSFVLLEDSLHTIYGEDIPCLRPALCDLDADGLQDLFCGQHTGRIWSYENVGDSMQYGFALISNYFSGIDVGSKASPTFCDIDADGDYDLFIGNEIGRVWYYRNDGDSANYNFTLDSNNWLGIDVRDYASPEFCDIDGDGDHDLFVGREPYNFISSPGDVFFYENVGTPQVASFQLVTTNYLSIDVGSYCGPVLVDFDADLDLDLLYSSQYHLGYFQNMGTTDTPSFSFVTDDVLNGIPPYGFDLYDLDADGDLDLIIANGNIGSGDIYFYRNQGTPGNPNFVYVDSIDTDFTLGDISLADMDADGDGDMIVPELFGGLLCFQNQGNAQNPNFYLLTTNYCSLGWTAGSGHDPQLVDMDLDGDFDMVAGKGSNAMVEYYENIGDPISANLVLVDPDLLEVGEIYGPRPFACDIDGDADRDLFVGTMYGGIHSFRNVTGEPPAVPPAVKHPQAGFHLSIGPNPANPVTVISFSLPYTQEATLAVYNLLGAKVTTLTSGLQPSGEQSFLWDASRKASGVYIIRLETEKYSSAQRLSVVK